MKAQAAIAHTFTTAEANAGKTPDRTNPQRVVLVVVVLIAIIQILVPRVVRVVLTRTPVIVASKPANHTPHREVLTTPRYLDAALINAIITFVLTIAILYFVFVAPFNRWRKATQPEQSPEPAPATDIELLTEIRDLLKRNVT